MTKVINSVTKKTQAAFEPSLDYIVTKIPRWDMSKFEGVSTQIGSAMKSVGEVMAIGRTQEESIQKALRMVDPAVAGFQPNMRFTEEELKEELNVPTDKRIFAIAQALHEKTMTVEEIHDITKIDHWFLRRLEAIVKTWDKMEQVSLDEMSEDLMLEAKKNGYSDTQISQCLQGTYTEDDIRNKRKGYGITPFTKQIDTLAAEYPAATNYLYMTYHGMEDDVEGADGGIITLGSGAYRIGSSIEFDWCGKSTAGVKIACIPFTESSPLLIFHQILYQLFYTVLFVRACVKFRCKLYSCSSRPWLQVHHHQLQPRDCQY